MSIQTRKLASDPAFAEKVRNQNATRPIVPITPEGQQVEEAYVPRTWDEGRKPYVGLMVRYFCRKGDHYNGKLSFPALILDFNRDGHADMVVFRGPREGDWVRAYAPQRSAENKEGSWEFLEPENDSAFAVGELIEGLVAQLADLDRRVGLLEAAEQARKDHEREKSGGAPRPPAKH